MRRIDWFSYVKLSLGTSMILPLEWAFWSLDFGNTIGFGIAISIHVAVLTIGIMMFNYLETGNIFELARKIE